MKLRLTHHGIARDPGVKSDDACRVQTFEGGVIAALADGLGASRDGGEAARRAVAMIVDYYLARPQAWGPRRSLNEFAARINRLFFQESQQRYGTPELLCTLSVVALEGDRVYGLNVGDSPVYRCRRGVVTRLSESHAMTEGGLEHVLTRAVGLEATVQPHAFEADVADGDVFFLCSDGVSNALLAADLAAALGRRASARSIVSAARERAEADENLRDDATAVVIDVVERGWQGDAARHSLEVAPVLRPGDSVDDYRLERSLQDGDRVWFATRTDGARHVLKFPPLEAADDEARRDAFVREMWNATRIQSPDFVSALPPPAAGPVRYYAMEFVEAPTLREILRAGPLSVEDARELGRFLLRAAQHLLACDLAHGDLKPDNILVLRPPEGVRFLLLDLGSAAEVFSVTSRAGTPSYLAPERFRGAPLAERTEIYAIGVTLYEALTRTYPYGEIERFQTPRFDTTPRPPSRLNPAVPPWFESVILRALEPEAGRRYQTLSEMAFQLDNPDQVEPFFRKNAPLLERNPLRFYKLLCLLLLGLNLLLLGLLARR
ncbi:MAG TPA: protein phosphatase 2C domain-containing protein [Opitutaceae bacterium]